jgi:hypothetical protein
MLVAEVRPGMETETEVGRIGRDEDSGWPILAPSLPR